MLNSIIGPRANQYLGAYIYTTTPRNKTVKFDKIKQIFAICYIFIIIGTSNKMSACSNIKKNCALSGILTFLENYPYRELCSL
jgi:hypothetical protein